jgi:hypothetical protein
LWENALVNHRDVAPLFLPMEQGSSIIQKTALDNCICGCWRFTGKELLKLDVIVLGTGMGTLGIASSDKRA